MICEKRFHPKRLSSTLLFVIVQVWLRPAICARLGATELNISAGKGARGGTENDGADCRLSPKMYLPEICMCEVSLWSTLNPNESMVAVVGVWYTTLLSNGVVLGDMGKNWKRFSPAGLVVPPAAAIAARAASTSA